MRYLLPMVGVCISCVTTSLPPARAAQGPPPVADANAAVTLRDDYLHTAFALYHAAAAAPGNVVVAPHASATALAMLYSGARGESAVQLARALRWQLPAARLDAAHAVLHNELLQRATGDTNTVLRSAGRLWLDGGMQVSTAYQAMMARYFGAGAGVVDFAGHPDDARSTINTWVAQNTAGLIPELLPSGAVGSDTRLVETCAMYLKANWLYPMDVAPAPALFHSADGTLAAVTMLDSRAGSKYHYAETPHLRAIEIYYEGAGLAMDIILPRGASNDWARHWHASAMRALSEAFAAREAVVRFPKFAVDYAQDLGVVLRDLGVHDLFDPRRADLSGIVEATRVRLDAAVGKAKITVDENGTEAAAATAVVVTPASAEPGEPVEFIVDQPFVFVLRDVAQNLILFMGRVEKL